MASRETPSRTRAKKRTRELEGGFLSLEEIDESENGLGIPNNGRENHKEKPSENAKLKKRKQNEDCDDGGSDKEDEGEGKENTVMAVEEVKKKDGKKKKRKKNKKKKLKKPEETADTVADDTEDNDDAEVEDPVDEAEYYAWNELRLHPQLMKSIYRLRFKEPTPIQQACIPAVAHHEMDIVGAASTGAGKTLAFGLPILHRLLEERDNIDYLVKVNGDADEKIASKGLLRALIVSPTRELALQVTDHLKEVANGTNIRVIPILGGMSTEKQENLLKSRPEIVVGTPDRLLELMLGGEIHLTELHSLLFFVVDDADHMKVSSHVQEMQSITDMLNESLVSVSGFQRKKWQKFIFCKTYCFTGESFSLTGSNELGGFLSLEEVDESEWLGIPNYGKEKPKENAKLNKRKHTEGCGNGGSDKDNEGEGKENVEIAVKEEEKKDAKKKKKRKKNTKKKLKKPEETAATVADDTEDNNDVEEEDPVDEAEYYAWNELRLHPELMKSIYRLRFKEPTPIQQACIPAAAHQGMDLNGNAATGTGKTLAFGLPILHRLLEERDKIDNLVEVNGDADEKIASKGLLRALILSPTRELALQVTNHLKEVAKGTNIRVISIVGGMSTEKQERLLKARPEIVVGTPDRLLELMLSGEIHLTELHSLSFFVVDDADCMQVNGQIQEMESIIDLLSMPSRGTIEEQPQNNQNCVTVLSFQRKKRQTFMFYSTFSHTFDYMRGVHLCPTTATALILSLAPTFSKEPMSRNRGGHKNVLDYWERIHPEAKNLIIDSHLGQFINNLGKHVQHGELISVLSERWWDSTHTFHLTCGEITMTPTDFTMITGLPCSGRPLEIDTDYYVRPHLVTGLLGTYFDEYTDEISMDELSDHIDAVLGDNDFPTDAVDMEQFMRCFLFFALGSTILTNASNTARLCILPSLEDISPAALDSFNWGGAGLATCYKCMDLLSRGEDTSVFGFSLAWEVWAYEVLSLNLFGRRYSLLSHSIPYMRDWYERVRYPHNGVGRYGIRSLRDLFDRPVENIKFYPWRSSIVVDPGTVAHTRSRWLLFTDMWESMYLGERVSRQWGPDLHVALVPHNPPFYMYDLSEFPGREALIEGVDAAELVHHHAVYDDFVGARVAMTPLSVSGIASTAATVVPDQEYERFNKHEEPPREMVEIPDNDIPTRFALPPSITAVTAESYSALQRKFYGLKKLLKDAQLALVNFRSQGSTPVVNNISQVGTS